MMRTLALIFSLATLGVSCATLEPVDYTQFKAHRPTSILVLPPINNSVEVGATQAYLSVITKPIAERGFYVFPVALVEHYFRSNGLTEPTDIHQLPLKKLQDVFNADAVFYVTIAEWGNSYQVVTSTTSIKAEGILVDAHTGTELWRGQQVAQQSSSSGSNSVSGILIDAVISQMAHELSDASRALARRSSHDTIFGPRGFIDGPLMTQDLQ